MTATETNQYIYENNHQLPQESLWEEADNLLRKLLPLFSIYAATSFSFLVGTMSSFLFFPSLLFKTVRSFGAVYVSHGSHLHFPVPNELFQVTSPMRRLYYPALSVVDQRQRIVYRLPSNLNERKCTPFFSASLHRKKLSAGVNTVQISRPGDFLLRHSAQRETRPLRID